MDHGNQIFTEQKLTVGVIFRCDDTDALVIVDREQNFLRQLSGQERAVTSLPAMQMMVSIDFS